MKGFIEFEYKGGRHLLNVSHIEEVIECQDSCYIYIAFNSPNAIEQDHYVLRKSYDEVTDDIARAMRT